MTERLPFISDFTFDTTDTLEISFEINEATPTCPRARVAKGHAYYPRDYSKFLNLLRNYFIRHIEALREGDEEFSKIVSEVNKDYKKTSELLDKFKDGAINMVLTFNRPIPKSTSKKHLEVIKASPYPKRPDVDNLTKSILDGINGILFADDAQVTNITSIKRYTDRDYPYTRVVIRLDN